MAPIPDEYVDLTNPIPAEAESRTRGQTIYEAKCSVCQGAENVTQR